MDYNERKVDDKFIKAGIAGVSCAGTSAILNPIDVTKIKMQVDGQGKGLRSQMAAIVRPKASVDLLGELSLV